VDFDLMLHLVRHLADWRFVLAGQYVAGSESGQALLRAPNVEYLGPVARDDLATRFAEADVALLPLPDTPLHQASFPIKVFDYLALGLPIVGRRSEPLQGLGDLILPAVTVEEYAGAMRSAIVMRDDPGFLARARRVALENSWEPRIEALTRSIRQELAGRSLTTRNTSRAGFMASGAGGRRDPNEPPE
jgi:glycosyltransferase involved in cell wall biosynthesis